MRNFAAVTLLVLFAGALEAQVKPSPHEFGTTDYVYTVIQAYDFRPVDSTTTYGTDGINVIRTSTTGLGRFWYTINLPSGSFLADVTVYGRDDDPTADLSAFLTVASRNSDTGKSTTVDLYTSASTTGEPGETALVLTYNNTFNHQQDTGGDGQIDDIATGVRVQLPNSNLVGFNAIRLRWKRQVSPAPATASFNDVPTTHPFFRFVEALFRSGITAGCGGGNYCPDQPLTRGQMAVFLSTALGLHWTP